MSTVGSLSPIRNLSHRAWYVWRRNLDVNLVTWQTNFLPPITEPVLYVLAFGFGLGQYVERMEYRGQEVGYLEFVAPGMIAVAVMFHAMMECMWGSFIRMYYQKTFDAIVATPLLIEDVILGEILWGATKALFTSTIMLGMLACFGLVSWPLGLWVIPVAALGGLVFGGVGMVCTGICKTIDVMNLPLFLVIMPMFLFSGTFFPLEALPPWGRVIAWASPLTHVAAGCRAATMGQGLAPVLTHLAVLAAATGPIIYLALRLMRRRLVK